MFASHNIATECIAYSMFLIQDKTRQEGNARQYNTKAIQYDTLQYNTIQCNAIQCNAIQCNAMQWNAMQCNAQALTTCGATKVAYLTFCDKMRKFLI